MQKKSDKNVILTLWNALGITVLVGFFLFSAIVGGSTGQGYEEGGKYFVGEHGNYTEVSQTVFIISGILETLFWIFIPLTPLGGFLIAHIQERIERKRNRFE